MTPAKSRFATDFGPAPSRRPARVADAIRNEIAVLLLRSIKDPRLQHIAITEVEMTSDLKHARVYYQCPDDQAKKAEDGLARAKGFIRSHLAKELALRSVPDLIFKRDLAMAKQEEMERLLQEIAKENETESR
ncbi:MAG: 30S ribosome-binding factor RbfA [Desulfobulbaceae bacterium]|nr:30S ribosome-binding factor RbfA [Desulfobulbaceae bacterium]